jgi:GT2 family glycosyltransferase
MICDVCKKEPAIYGDGMTWARCAKCNYEFNKKQGIEEPKEQEGIPLEGMPHQTINGITSIIIPIFMKDYSLFHLTGNCIGAVREHTHPEDYELIVVDNGSPIQPPDLKTYYANKVIKNDTNLGYTKAVNQGIRAAFGEYVVLLSNDVQVYQGWLSVLKQALDEGLDLAMAHPMYSLTEPFARAVESEKVMRGEKKFDPIPGDKDFSCVMFKKSLIDELGLFDEQFFNYCSDSDFLRRMEQAGKKYGIVDRVATHHISSATGYAMEGTPDIMNEDKKRFEEKWKNNTQTGNIGFVKKEIICPWCQMKDPTVEHFLTHA